MKNINITSNTYAYVIIRDLSLKPGASGTIDADILLLTELKGLRNLAIVRDIIISDSDYDYIVAKIAEMGGGTGGDSPVRSVNSEIGDVVLTAGKIKVGNGSTIEQEFDKLSTVSYTGSYLDLNDRPSGPGEPFTVIDWNPYREDLVQKPFTPANPSTIYNNGVITRALATDLNPILVDIGYPNSPEIVVTNGIPTVLTLTPDGSNNYSKTLALKEISTFSLKPVDFFEHNGNPKGASVNFFVFQLEEGEDVTTMTIEEIVGKTHSINISFTNMYQLESNSYSSLSYSVLVNNSNVGSGNMPFYGNYDSSNFKVADGKISIGNGFSETSLIDNGFSPTKKYAALCIIQLSSSSFDVATPFHLEMSTIQAAPELANILPDQAEVVISADAELLFVFEDDNSNFFTVSFMRPFNDLSYSSNSDGQSNIESNFINSNGDITLKVDGNLFQFKDYSLNSFTTVHTATTSLYKVHVLTMSDSFGNTSKNSWNFTINNWAKIEVLDGVLPSNAVDGSTIRVTHNGKYDGINLIVGDIINPYDNKTKFILHRNGQEVGNDVNTAGALPVSGDAVKAYSPTASTLAGETLESIENKLNIKISPNPGNMSTSTNNGLFTGLPNILNAYVLREAALISNYQTSVQLGLGNRSIFTINAPSSDVYTYFTNLTDYDVNNPNTAIAKTITILIIDASSITWPTEIIWADGTAPTIEPNKYLLVNGIHVKSGQEETTSGKVLCTFNYFNR